jgi:HTH-type transcriptional repressor of NAD biosynthesis genes
MTARSALVIGKFLPPHAGHSALVEHARTAAAQVDIVVCGLRGQRPDAASRARWLAAVHPDVRVHVVDDLCGWHSPAPCPAECSPAWAAHLRDLGLGPWDVVVTSEPYGEPFAAALGARAIAFDPARKTIPLSGTSVRRDVRGHWLDLHPLVRAGLVRRVVILGAESTGTTTLATDLASHLGPAPVPEYGRAYTEQLAAAAGGIGMIRWRDEDFARIAKEQIALEDAALAAVASGPPAWLGTDGPVVVCDTDVLATAVWRERYLGAESRGLLKLASTRTPALYVLTSPDGVPFEQDGLRDGEHLREWMTGRFRETLANQIAPWIEVTGSPSRRTEVTLQAVRSLPPLFASGGTT